MSEHPSLSLAAHAADAARAAHRAIRLSPSFNLAEMAVSASHPHLVELVPDELVPTVTRLATTGLQPLRDVVGPLRITSGYRAARLNAAVGGSPDSQHRRGEAADVVGLAVSTLELFGACAVLAADGWPVGQVIAYPADGFVHVALPSRRFPKATLCLRWPSAFVGYPVVQTWGEVGRFWPAARTFDPFVRWAVRRPVAGAPSERAPSGRARVTH